ncbi:MAG: type II secretion system protein [bacterium]|nr:type II secretion system protein [bacterium]
MTQHTPLRTNQRLAACGLRLAAGFTLVEVLTVLAVTAAVLALLVAISVSMGRSFRVATAQRDATITAERALDRLVGDVRAARIGADGGHPLRTADDQELVITSDVDDDGDAEWVRYTLVDATSPDGGRLERSVIEASGAPPRYDLANIVTDVLARGIRNESQPIFTYYRIDYPTQPSGNPLPAPIRLSETRHIRMELAINLDPVAIATTTVTSAATIRNLREGQ